MALGSIWINDGTKTGRLKPVSAEKALEVWNALNGITEPNEAQAEFLNTVRDVFVPPSYQNQAEGYIQAHRHAKPSGIVPNTFNPETAVTDSHNTPDDNELTHPGISQGSMQGLPVNDR